MCVDDGNDGGASCCILYAFDMDTFFMPLCDMVDCCVLYWSQNFREREKFFAKLSDFIRVLTIFL